MTPENTFIASVHKHLPPGIYHMKLHNVYLSGPADCWYSGKRDVWVEYKFIVLPKRSSTMIVPNLSALQLDWCTGRRDEGRNVLVIVGCKEGGVVLRDPRSWSAGLPQAAFVAQLKKRSEIAQVLAQEAS